MKRNVRIFRYKTLSEYNGGVCPITAANMNHVPCFIEITPNQPSCSLKQEPEGIDSAGYPCGALEPPQGALQEEQR